MRAQVKLVSFTISKATAILFVLIILPIFVNSSQDHHQKSENIETKNKNQVQISPKLSFQITLHGFLLWASMGILIPLGVLIIRISNREKCGKRLKILFYIHATLQMLAVLLATAGAIMSIIYFDNSFRNAHQRMGLTLYVALWLQALIGFMRPKRGSRGRSLWFVGHWVFGTTVSVLGIINIYTGLHAYHKRTSKSISIWTVLFTIQISIMAFLYLFQDKWAYIQKQGVILGHEPVQPTDQIVSPRYKLKDIMNDNII